MALLVVSIVFVVFQTALVVYVLTRAPGYGPAKLFAITTATLGTLTITPLFSSQAATPQAGYATQVLLVLALGGFNFALMLLLSMLFAPRLWQSPRPILWISAPFVLVLGILALGLFGQFSFLVAGVSSVGGQTRIAIRAPLNSILLWLFMASWLVHLGILLVALVRQPRSRRAVGMMFVAITVAFVLDVIDARIVPLGLLRSYLSTAIILAPLAYIVLRTRLLVPTDAALSLALRSMQDTIAVIDRDDQFTYLNDHAAALGLRQGMPARAQLAALSADGSIPALLDAQQHADQPQTARAMVAEQHLALTLAPVRNAKGHTQGTLLLGRDITTLEQRTAELEQRNAEQQRLLDLVADLETPSVAVAAGVLLAPIIGHIDTQRAQALTARLLRETYDQRMRLVILDISGVPVIDTAVAGALLGTVQALRLLGCNVTLSGISSATAITLTQQGVSMAGVRVVRSPQEALEALAASPQRVV